MSASPSTHYQDVDRSFLLPLVSCWSPGQVPTSADVVYQLRGKPCQSLHADNRSSDAFDRALKRHLFSIWRRLPLFVLQHLLMWHIINALIIIIIRPGLNDYIIVIFASLRSLNSWVTLGNDCGRLDISGWPLVWETWKCQGIWQLSGKCQGFY